MNTVGMDAATGALLDEEQHIRQSLHDIITTPVGSRVMRRDYGSLVPRFVDAPGNGVNRLRLLAAAAMPIIRWEPRVAIKRLGLDIGSDGRALLNVDVTRRSGPAARAPLAVAIELGAP